MGISREVIKHRLEAMVKAEGMVWETVEEVLARCGDIAGVGYGNSVLMTLQLNESTGQISPHSIRQARSMGQKEGEKDMVALVTAVRKPAAGSAGIGGVHSRTSLKRS